MPSDPEPSARIAAIQALKRYPSREALQVVQAAADGDTDQDVRVVAARVAEELRAVVEKMEGGG